ncbi:YfdX family protein [Nitratifractor salsuginis]|uniref:YfdX family protein n=1 Tax=Nitratifractor salsuginis (strain DSM 16511 / JCM 12458 / E9I37-1) TaxID=749222 RepID=E6X3E6_NITSE|nr:YfdX family protein [Nitratifractor salsuginis]ADV46223.1 hypothetical protein Nitsa_0964 [Nitratifractor salsuginis DSM 16511]
MKKLMISAVAAAVLSGGVASAATQQKRAVLHNEVAGANYYSMQKKAARAFIPEAIKAHHAATPKPPKEILQAFGDTVHAVQAIQHKDTKAAQKYLTEADKLFSEMLKKHPELKFVPINEVIMVNDVIITPEGAKKIVDTSRELLKYYRTQAARDLLVPMKDEMDVMTSYLPMALYPVATKKALAAVKKGDVKSAIAILADAFNTIMTVKTVIPIPLLAAQDFVRQAAALDKSKKEEALKFLEAAKAELQKAYYFGYTDTRSKAYKDLYDQINAIEKEIKGKNMVEKMYEHLKSSFKNLIGKIYSDMRDTVAAEEAKVMKNPKMINGAPSAKAKEEELQEKQNFEAKMKISEFGKEVEADLKKAPVNAK